MDRILQSTQATHKLITIFNGVKANVSTSLTVSVKDSGGTEIATPTPTNPAAGEYEITLSSTDTANLDVFDVTWTQVGGEAQIFQTNFQTVGGFLFNSEELTDFDSDLTSKSLADINVAREAAEERIERLCGVAFVPRGKRVYLDGNGTRSIMVPDVELRGVTSAKVDGTALTAGELADLVVYPHGEIVREELGSWDDGLRNCEILYSHGLDAPPEPVRRAAMALARSVLIEQAQFDRAASQTTEFGTISFSLAGRDGPTGIPEVDAVIHQYSRNQIRVV